MLKRYILLIAIIALFVAGAATAFAANQSHSHVSVVTPKTGTVEGITLPNVPVVLEGTSIYTKSDTNGKFTLNNVPAGVFYALVIGPLGNHSSYDSNYLVYYNINISADKVLNLGRLNTPNGYRLLR